MLATVSLLSHSPCDTSAGVDLMPRGPLARWVCWRGIFWADANSLLAFEWIQTINLVTARCLCYPMQKRLLCGFWHSTSPPFWLASLAAYYQLTVKSQVHLASPHPDAKGCFSAWLCWCLQRQDSICATILLPKSKVCDAAALWHCCSSSCLLGDPHMGNPSPAGIFCNFSRNSELDHHPSMSRSSFTVSILLLWWGCGERELHG